jgi:hypothetical protein
VPISIGGGIYGCLLPPCGVLVQAIQQQPVESPSLQDYKEAPM